MTEATATKKSPVHDDTKELAAKMSTDIHAAVKTGVPMSKEDSLYSKLLPDGLTMEHVASLSDYNTNFIAAGALAFGEAGLNAMVSDKKLDTVTIDIPMGVKDNVSFTMDRRTENVNRFSKEPETIIKHGVITPTYTVRAGKNSGQLKAVRAHIATLAAEAMSK